VDGFGTALEFFARFLARAEEKIWMSLRVIADEVAARDGFLGQCRTLLDEFADQEKGGFGVVFIEEIDEFWSDGWIGTIVERQRQ